MPKGNYKAIVITRNHYSRDRYNRVRLYFEAQGKTWSKKFGVTDLAYPFVWVRRELAPRGQFAPDRPKFAGRCGIAAAKSGPYRPRSEGGPPSVVDHGDMALLPWLSCQRRHSPSSGCESRGGAARYWWLGQTFLGHVRFYRLFVIYLTIFFLFFLWMKTEGWSREILVARSESHIFLGCVRFTVIFLFITILR